MISGRFIWETLRSEFIQKQSAWDEGMLEPIFHNQAQCSAWQHNSRHQNEAIQDNYDSRDVLRCGCLSCSAETVQNLCKSAALLRVCKVRGFLYVSRRFNSSTFCFLVCLMIQSWGWRGKFNPNGFSLCLLKIIPRTEILFSDGELFSRDEGWIGRLGNSFPRLGRTCECWCR